MKRFLISLLTATFALVSHAQNSFTLNSPQEMIKENIVRAANEMSPYETLDLTDRIAPEGYEPFYVMFISRGGNRDGKILPSGNEELAGIAQRLVKRFPQIWTEGGEIRSYSMPSVRNSEETFISALTSLCGVKPVRNTLAEGSYHNIRYSYTDPAMQTKDSLLRHYGSLGDADALERLVGVEDAVKLWSLDNAHLFHEYCISKENKGTAASKQLPLLSAITAEVSDAAKGQVQASSFRFVDIASFQGLVSLIGASGNDYVRTETVCNQHFAGFISLCSNANFQIVLYRNKEGKVLAKMMHNEREIGIPTLKAFNQNVYYEWESLRSYLEDRLDGNYIKPALVQSVIYNKILKNDDTQLNVIGKVKLPETGPRKNPFWSIDCGTLDRDYADFSQYQPFLNELGAGYVRIQSGWQKTEKVKGLYSFGWLDEIVDGILDAGLSPWIVLGYGNTNYCNTGTSLASEIFTDEVTLSGWCNYVEALVKHFKGKISAYEIWNEPNFGGTLRRALPYAGLFSRTAPIIRDNDPDAKIVGLALGAEMGLDFTGIVLDQLKKDGTFKYLDAISFHPYSSHPEKKKKQIVALRDFVAAYSGDIKLLCGEVGYISDLYVRNQKESTELIQAKWVLRQMAMEFGLNMPTNIFSMIDNLYPDRLQSYGMLRANILKEAVYKRPQFYAYRNTTSILSAGTYSKGDMKTKSKADKKISAVNISRSGKDIGVMLWYPASAPDNNMSKDRIDILIEGLHLENPVYVDPLTGRVYRLAGAKDTKAGLRLKQLPLWDSTIMVIEESALK